LAALAKRFGLFPSFTIAWLTARVLGQRVFFLCDCMTLTTGSFQARLWPPPGLVAFFALTGVILVLGVGLAARQPEGRHGFEGWLTQAAPIVQASRRGDFR